MDFNVIKALHIIFVVSWFAGLFYMVRLFIYHIEAQEKTENEARILGDQFKIMEKKLWYVITTPAMVLTVIFGTWMLYEVQGFLKMPWMHVKLGCVFALYLYHWKCQIIFNELQKDEVKYSNNWMRLFNEGATIILFAVVFLVILKNAVNWIYGVIGIFLFSITIMLGFKFYKKIRERNQS